MPRRCNSRALCCTSVSMARWASPLRPFRIASRIRRWRGNAARADPGSDVVTRNPAVSAEKTARAICSRRSLPLVRRMAAWNRRSAATNCPTCTVAPLTAVAMSSYATEMAVTSEAVARRAAMAAAAGSITLLTSARFLRNDARSGPSRCHASTSGSSSCQASRARTRVPKRGRASTSPFDINTLIASRSAVRLTGRPRGRGRASPGWILPVRIWRPRPCTRRRCSEALDTARQ